MVRQTGHEPPLHRRPATVLIRRENIEALHFTVWEELDPPLLGATTQQEMKHEQAEV
ncbi:MAG: hypothetical protein OXG27_13820 [Chloroflexi bacterium]|nr:hypothetical protein [Chloroflexota bacterium]